MREMSRPHLVVYRPGKRRIARDRLRRGDLFSQARAGLRVRHVAHPLQLCFADDAAGDLRLRCRHAAAARSSSGRRCRAASIPQAYVARLVFAPAEDGESVPVSLLLQAGPEARRIGAACSSPATAPTAMRPRRASRPTASRWSTAASCSRSPMCAAARTRAGAGTRTASSRKKPNTFHDFLAAVALPHRRGLHQQGADRRAGRQRRRHADGRDRQSRAGPVRRNHRRRAVRRRAGDHARREPAADPGRMAGMGRSDPRPGGVRHHPLL